ncbi:MAG: hypothetical protein V4488_06935 [Pseudomonadota bacterium]
MEQTRCEKHAKVEGTSVSGRVLHRLLNYPRGWAIAFAFALPLATHAADSIDRAQAASIFRQADIICARDGGAFWGHTLCGPMLLVDPSDRSVVANQADAAGVLQPADGVFIGVLPADQPISDTTITWSGTRWCELIWPWPMRQDPDMLHVTLAHELFHRIQQEELHIGKQEGGNAHLDTLDGRYLIELEWRALAAALQASTAGGRRTAAADAILFRGERYRLFPSAADNELALESNEGIAEYTGVRLGLQAPEQRVRYALRDLAAGAQAPSFVRSFAYATGPAYGLLLDQADPAWVGNFVASQRTERFDQRLGRALHLAGPDFSRLAARTAVYDSDGKLRVQEVAREEEKRNKLMALKAKLIDGPVLSLPLVRSSIEFNPQSLVPIDNIGTVYPTLTLRDNWGTLVVESGGALLRKQPKQATVSASGLDPTTLRGQGFSLVLKPGWSIQPGSRSGDLVVSEVVKTAP